MSTNWFVDDSASSRRATLPGGPAFAAAFVMLGGEWRGRAIVSSKGIGREGVKREVKPELRNTFKSSLLIEGDIRVEVERLREENKELRRQNRQGFRRVAHALAPGTACSGPQALYSLAA
jgi:hypothetical protein